MKRLSRLKLSENQILPKSSLNHLLGGGNDEPIDGGYLPEVVVYGSYPHKGEFWECAVCQKKVEILDMAEPLLTEDSHSDVVYWAYVLYHYCYQWTHY